MPKRKAKHKKTLLEKFPPSEPCTCEICLLTFGVLSPAFKGCERSVATTQFSNNGCTFLQKDRCEMYGTGYQPLECRFCHHERRGLGTRCHAELEKDWKTPAGQALIETWIKQVGRRRLP
jgi:hypothetical protein